ncbi:hypothetical protein B0H12DRAFT_223322 [Mycena haematopus]|nr:hypothetical protein B0H12DRAFT_223322 [Mycena haematopus]
MVSAVSSRVCCTPPSPSPYGSHCARNCVSSSSSLCSVSKSGSEGASPPMSTRASNPMRVRTKRILVLPAPLAFSYTFAHAPCVQVTSACTCPPSLTAFPSAYVRGSVPARASTSTSASASACASTSARASLSTSASASAASASAASASAASASAASASAASASAPASPQPSRPLCTLVLNRLVADGGGCKRVSGCEGGVRVRWWGARARAVVGALARARVDSAEYCATAVASRRCGRVQEVKRAKSDFTPEAGNALGAGGEGGDGLERGHCAVSSRASPHPSSPSCVVCARAAPSSRSGSGSGSGGRPRRHDTLRTLYPRLAYFPHFPYNLALRLARPRASTSTSTTHCVHVHVSFDLYSPLSRPPASTAARVASATPTSASASRPASVSISPTAPSGPWFSGSLGRLPEGPTHPPPLASRTNSRAAPSAPGTAVVRVRVLTLVFVVPRMSSYASLPPRFSDTPIVTRSSPPTIRTYRAISRRRGRRAWRRRGPRGKSRVGKRKGNGKKRGETVSERVSD